MLESLVPDPMVRVQAKAPGKAAPCTSSNLVVWKSGAERGFLPSTLQGEWGATWCFRAQPLETRHARANPTLP